jgi:hypothetical protein
MSGNRLLKAAEEVLSVLGRFASDQHSGAKRAISAYHHPRSGGRKLGSQASGHAILEHLFQKPVWSAACTV